MEWTDDQGHGDGRAHPRRSGTHCVRRARGGVHPRHDWSDGRLYATYKDGRARFNGYLDDYASLADGLLALLASRWNAVTSSSRSRWRMRCLRTSRTAGTAGSSSLPTIMSASSTARWLRFQSTSVHTRRRLVRAKCLLQITPDNVVRFYCPRDEMGQGVTTGLATIIGEELDVAPWNMEIVFAGPHEDYANPICSSRDPHWASPSAVAPQSLRYRQVVGPPFMLPYSGCGLSAIQERIPAVAG